jgi:hypothetical protein
MAGRLDTAIQNVDPESLPGPDTTPADAGEPYSGSVSGNKDGQGSKDEDKGGRTVDNVRGELMRKLNQEREFFTSQIQSLESKIDQLVAAGTSIPGKSKASPNTLDDLSIAELKTLRTNVPEEQREAFEEYFEERRVREQVETQVKAITNKQSFAQQEQAATEQALTRWPELRDATSELYRTTNKVLAQMGKIADGNPRAVLDAANEAGMQLGLSPKTAAPRRMRSVKSPVSGATDAPVDSGAPAVDAAEMQRIASRLGSATKGGKFSQEQMDRIMKNAAEYRRHQDLLVK